MTREIYLDNASSTPIDLRVQKEMDRAFMIYGNPSSLNFAGKKAQEALEKSRKSIIKNIGAKNNEVIFTGSGTEANNLALIGTALANKKRGNHLIVSNIEHKSVLASAEYLSKNGFKISYVKVEKNGLIKPEEVAKKIRKSTILISIMMANNEIGTIQSIRQIAYAVKKKNDNIIFHTDACQALGYLDIKVGDLNIDLMSFNSSKIYGPKGVGGLYIKSSIQVQPIILGGDQEKGLRSGTENTAGIVGFARALEISKKNRAKEVRRLTNLRNYFIKKINSEFPDTTVNGHKKLVLPNNVNLSFPNTDSEFLVLNLDKQGIRVSSGSACQVHDSSHVLKAIGINDNRYGTVRFSFGRSTKKEDIDYVLKKLPSAVNKSRK